MGTSPRCRIGRGEAVTITRLIERLPADERLAVRKLCKIRGETFEEFTRFAIWKAAQAFELGADDYEALAVESRSRDGTVASQTALVTTNTPLERPGPPGGPRRACRQDHRGCQAEGDHPAIGPA
jgi:hypothetical protein